MNENNQIPPQPKKEVPPQTYYHIDTSRKESNASVWALVLGILSWVTCGIFTAIPAWIIGQNELAAIKRGESSAEGKTMAQIGMWLGISNIILSILAILFTLIVLILGFGLGLGILTAIFENGCTY
ncbi:MAG: DUF4190 domain-containing protein [Ignavibacteria bacterium]|nr:DUF4190 domain-containing protein [Ignavibacteria bacterium]